MREVLLTLKELQYVDNELQTLEQKKGDLPNRVNALKSEMESLQQQLDEKTEKNREESSLRSRQENELELLRQQLKKYQKQLYQVKTNKEYDAITLEIEETESGIERLEFNNLELEESIEKRNQEIQELEASLNALETELEQSRDSLEKVMARTRDQEKVLREKKESTQTRLTKPILSTYERIRNGRGGSAVAFLINGACSACSSRVPPQRGVEIRMMNKLFLCETCGRILIYDSEKE